MLFYRAIDAAGKLRLAGNQADAKLINKEFDQIDVPTDKPGLLAFLGELLDQLPPIAAPQGEEPAAEAIVAAEDAKPDLTDIPEVPEEEFQKMELKTPTPAAPNVDDVLDFVLNTATTSQVENIFSALGTRFAEEIGA